MSEDSLKKRYFFKLSSNLIGLGINMITQAIIPRGLGPQAYGDFNFISNFFNQFVSFLDLGTSTAFYTKLSQRPKDSSLVSFYLFYFTAFISFLLILFVAIASSTAFKIKLWPGQEVSIIYMGAVFGVLSWITMVLGKMADAYGITVSAEIARMLQKVLGLVFITVLYIFHLLSLTNFFYYHYLTLSILGIALISVMANRLHPALQNYKLSFIQFKNYSKEFYQYSHPLFVYALAGLITGILDRWLLQIFAGSIQQGFFGLSYQIGAFCFLFTSAMTPLLLREFSSAHINKDLTQMAVLFRRYIPMLYSMAAYFACFIAVQADKVIYLFGGNNYKEAGAVVAIMAFYPIHQTYGQLSGSVFFATGQTVLYRNIGIIFMIVGLPVTYFLLAPTARMGLNSGATGLAIKMVFLQFIAVNVQLYFNAKFLKLSFWKYLGHQLFSVGCLLALAFLSTIGVDRVLGLSASVISSFLVAGILYSFGIAIIIYFMPIVFGIKKEDIEKIIEILVWKLRRV